MPNRKARELTEVTGFRPYRRFQNRGPAFDISVGSTGFTFGAAFLEKYGLGQPHSVLLLEHPDHKTIGFKFTNEYKPGAYKLYSVSDLRWAINTTTFIRVYPGGSAAHKGRYKARVAKDPELGEIFVIDLKK